MDRKIVFVALLCWVLLLAVVPDRRAHDAVPFFAAASLVGTDDWDAIYHPENDDLRRHQGPFYEASLEQSTRGYREQKLRADDSFYLDFLSPPSATLAALPLANTTPRVALFVWTILPTLSAAAAVALLARHPSMAGRSRLLAGATIAVSPLVLASARIGQTSALFLFVVLAPLLSSRRAVTIGCGVAYGLLITLKPSFALVGLAALALPALRPYRRPYVLGLGLAGSLAVVSLLMLRVELWGEFVATALNVSEFSRNNPDNASLATVVPIWLLLPLGVALATSACRRFAPDLALCVVWLACLMVSPLYWVNYLLIAMAVAIYLLATRELRPLGRTALVATLATSAPVVVASFLHLYDITVGLRIAALLAVLAVALSDPPRRPADRYSNLRPISRRISTMLTGASGAGGPGW